MKLIIFLKGENAQSLEFDIPDECLLNEQHIKQHLLDVLNDSEDLEQDTSFILNEFIEGDWEVVDSEGNSLFSHTAKEQPQMEPAVDNPQSSLMAKIEQLQQSQSTIKSLSAEIEQEALQVSQWIAAIESKEQQVQQLRAEQKEISKELTELQQLLNELLVEEA